ncbi:exonuclease domain-containing protein [Vibrio sp. Vb0587]|uniref:exonuclease domain-containing protein n=1 Tax=Vibrio sp. Vb0587 TaxID=3074626 RepID=UPI0029650582|nr:exonuclease domain-containing protein [Vibrio sp. Vb0587]MDW1964071.1 exonuclease domain-containing protein [Vibrio sp. Vb0587]
MFRIVVIDTETTGLSTIKGDRIIEIAATEIIDGEITSNKFHYYLNPEGRKSHKKAFNLHKIKDEFLLDKPVFSEITDAFLDFCEGADELTFYNRKFDAGFIQHELTNAQRNVWITDKFKTSCLMLDYAEKYNNNVVIKLDDACLRFGIDISQRKQHGAVIDADLAASLYLKCHHSETKPLKHTPQKGKRQDLEDTEQENENGDLECRKVRPVPRAFVDKTTERTVQLNFCKNPNCSNYGIAAKNPKLNKDGTPILKGKGTNSKYGLANLYTFANMRIGRGLQCQMCNTKRILINNRAVVNEANRLKQAYKILPITCPDVSFKRTRRVNKCRNCEVDFLEKPERYNLKDIYYDTSNGKKVAISQRLECRACKQSFRVPLIGRAGKQKTEIDSYLFKSLVNKVVLNRITEIFDVDMSFIYSRIEFYYRQCLEFDRWHLEQNIHALNNKDFVFSMDRQHYLVNWTDARDSRPTKLVNTSTVDNESRYVFASTLNFDITSDSVAIRKDSDRLRDHEKETWRRKYAQYVFKDKDLEKDDVDDDIPLKPPIEGLLVQQTYSALAHLEFMKEIYDQVGHVTLFADNDEGFDLGISVILKDYIESYKIFPFLIKAERNNASQSQDKQAWSEEVLQRHDLSRMEIDKLPKELQHEEFLKLSQKYWIAESQKMVKKSGYMKSEWLVHPFTGKDRHIQIKPLMNIFISQEHLNNLAEQTGSNIAENLLYSSLQGVDNYFQMIRRRLNMLERPITSATNGHRWNGYASYNPKWSVMLLEILRVYLNYTVNDKKILDNKKSKRAPMTPAQKIGFADKKYTIDDILDFTVANKVINMKRNAKFSN